MNGFAASSAGQTLPDAALARPRRRGRARTYGATSRRATHRREHACRSRRRHAHAAPAASEPRRAAHERAARHARKVTRYSAKSSPTSRTSGSLLLSACALSWFSASRRPRCESSSASTTTAPSSLASSTPRPPKPNSAHHRQRSKLTDLRPSCPSRTSAGLGPRAPAGSPLRLAHEPGHGHPPRAGLPRTTPATHQATPTAR